MPAFKTQHRRSRGVLVWTEKARAKRRKKAGDDYKAGVAGAKSEQ
jgi:hypothetical protein